MIFENLNKTHVESIREYRDKFLDMGYVPLLFKADSLDEMYYLYIIENMINGKKYVGKCKNIYDRCNGYIRNYLDPSARKRKIDKAITEFGIENFKMYPFATCNGAEKVAILEQKFISKLNTISDGYNISTICDTANNFKRSSVPQTIDAKMKKSKIMLCINPEEKVAFISVGMKLFGDYTNSTKDVVKNCAKRPGMHKGYYIIYLNTEDRMHLYKLVLDRINRQPNIVYNTARKLYLQLSEIAGKIAENPSAIKEYLPDYELFFMTYNEMANTVKPYKICPIEDFINLTEN